MSATFSLCTLSLLTLLAASPARAQNLHGTGASGVPEDASSGSLITPSREIDVLDAAARSNHRALRLPQPLPIAVRPASTLHDQFTPSTESLLAQRIGGSTGYFSKPLLILGVATLAAGSYLVATTPRGYLFTSLIPGTLQIRSTDCLSTDPYAGTGAPEIRCSPLARNIGIGLIIGGASGIAGAFLR